MGRGGARRVIRSGMLPVTNGLHYGARFGQLLRVFTASFAGVILGAHENIVLQQRAIARRVIRNPIFGRADFHVKLLLGECVPVGPVGLERTEQTDQRRKVLRQRQVDGFADEVDEAYLHLGQLGHSGGIVQVFGDKPNVPFRLSLQHKQCLKCVTSTFVERYL